MNAMGPDSDEKRSIPLRMVRNIGIMAHIDAGKTTLTERILYYSGVTWRMGEVHEGTATMDWMIQEQERGITISSAATSCLWEKHKINIVDTPGHVDFTAEVERSLRVLDGVVAVFCSVSGVQAQTEIIWHQASKYKIPAVAFVNKMDRIGADFSTTVREMRDQLGMTPVPVLIPWGEGEAFQGVIDLMRMEAIAFSESDFGREMVRKPIPDDYREIAGKARRHMVECLAECDETVMEAFLLDAEPVNTDLHAALRKGTLERALVPVACGSAFGNKGVQPLLDLVVDCLPSPADVPPIEGVVPESRDREQRMAEDNQPFASLIFKTMTDPTIGHIAFVRIYSGTASAGTPVYHSGSDAVMPLGRLLQVHANSYQECPVVFSGDIVALVGMPGLRTGETLCAAAHPVLLEALCFPEPVMTMAVEPKRSDERDRMMFALRDLTLQDPTFRIRTDSVTGQTILEGMGELHLEVICDRMRRECGIDVTVGRPQVARRTTVKKVAEKEARLDRTIGAIRQVGSLKVSVEPLKRGKGMTLEITAPETQVPRVFHSAIRDGIHSAVEDGLGTGHPLTDLRVSVHEGSSVPNESTEQTFRLLSLMAFEQAAKEAGMGLLEPLMTVVVSCPPEVTGDVIGDMGMRHGRVIEVEALPRTTRITCLVPLAAMFGYATALRSFSSGRAVFSSEFACFAEASDQQNTVNIR